jgi:predicted ATPase
MTRKEAWLDYSRRLYDAGLSIIAEADRLAVGSSTKDPKVLALALLCRTLSNFNGAVLMIEAAMPVEARTLTRCCFENLLWLAELADKGEAFVEEMVRDEVSSQQARGNMVLSWSGRLESQESYVEGLRDNLERMREKHPKAKAIRFGELGKGNNIAASYLWFRQLSSDAAHPSLTSLSRYMSKQPNNVVMLSIAPDMKEKEAEDTLQYATQAMMGVCVATCTICNVPNSHAALSPLFEEFMVIAKADGSFS